MLFPFFIADNIEFLSPRWMNFYHLSLPYIYGMTHVSKVSLVLRFYVYKKSFLFVTGIVMIDRWMERWKDGWMDVYG